MSSKKPFAFSWQGYQHKVPLATGDTIQVYVKCSTHAITITLDNLNVIINEF